MTRPFPHDGRMQVHLYTLAWNEADTLPFFFRHYDPWVDRYIVFDDGSTDGTAERLAEHPRVELRRFVRSEAASFVESHRRLQNHVWKESRGRAGWVVITAIDEHLHVPRLAMREYLTECGRRQVTCIPALGFQMVSEDFPAADERLCETRTRGAPFWEMNKLSVFDPNAITETGFAPGRHRARPAGRVTLPDRDELLLLHYKYLGFERTYRRHVLLRSGLGPDDLARGRGVQYAWSRDRLRVEWDAFARRAVDVSDPALEPWRTHRVPRWWRSPVADRAASVARKLRRSLEGP
jgi:hypothetical protein